MKLCIALLAVSVALTACSSSPTVNSATPEKAYAVAEKYEKDERYEEALAQYALVKNKHPYSTYATDAELRIAEIHFKREDFAEAQAAYETFKELHPSHAKIDYVTYRLGLSLYNQLPPTIDRDLSLADKSLLYFDEVLTSFPRSEYLALAQEHKNKILNMLSEKELYIGDFYFIRHKYDSALGRYEGLIEKFPQSQFLARALKGAAISAHKNNDGAKAQQYLQKLEQQFAGSKELSAAKGALGVE